MAQTCGGFSARFAPTERPAFHALRAFVAGSNDECPIVVLPRPGWLTGNVRHECGAGIISDAANGHSETMIFNTAVGRKPTGSFLGGMTENLSTAYVKGFALLTAPEALHGNSSFASGPVNGKSRRSAVKPSAWSRRVRPSKSRSKPGPAVVRQYLRLFAASAGPRRLSSGSQQD